jgi:hypothetical protein
MSATCALEQIVGVLELKKMFFVQIIESCITYGQNKDQLTSVVLKLKSLRPGWKVLH